MPQRRPEPPAIGPDPVTSPSYGLALSGREQPLIEQAGYSMTVLVPVTYLHSIVWDAESFSLDLTQSPLIQPGLYSFLSPGPQHSCFGGQRGCSSLHQWKNRLDAALCLVVMNNFFRKILLSFVSLCHRSSDSFSFLPTISPKQHHQRKE